MGQELNTDFTSKYVFLGVKIKDENHNPSITSIDYCLGR